jgi:translation elongation factor EF-1alpha
MVEIYKKADKRNCRTLEENPKKINNGDVAWVRFVPNRPLCVE